MGKIEDQHRSAALQGGKEVCNMAWDRIMTPMTTFHPQGTIYNSKQHAEAFQDGGKTIRKVNQNETIHRDSCELVKCYLDT